MTAGKAREPRHRRTPDVVEETWRVRDDELDMRLYDLKAKYQWEFADRLFEAGVAPMGEPQWSIRIRPRLFRGEVISDVIARVEVEPWVDRALRGRRRAEVPA